MPEVIIGVKPNLEVRITGETLDLIRELAFWDSLPALCPACLKDEKESQLVFTFRTPTAKSGSREGETFTYYGMECLGTPSHEVQFSQRKENKGGGLYIRMPNRKDGKPNWRLSYGAAHDDDDEEPYRAPGADRQPPATAGGSEVDQRVAELLKLGREKGYINEAALNTHCRSLYGKDVRDLCSNKESATEYYRTLRAM